MTDDRRDAREAGAPAGPHGRARELAAARVDAFLEPDEAAWLDDHLETCDPCTAYAAELDAQDALFAPYRGSLPQAPRDLWARTAAALDRERPRHARRVPGTGSRLGGWALAPLAGLMVVAIAVGSGLLNGGPAQPTPRPSLVAFATPIIIDDGGEIRVLTTGEDGTLQLGRTQVREVCPVGAVGCTATSEPRVTQTERLDSSTTLDAIISPGQDQLVILQGGDDSQGVIVVPVRNGASPSPSQPTPEPTPTQSPSPTPTTSAPAGSEPATASAPAGSATPDTGSPTPAVSSLEPSPGSPTPVASDDTTPSPSASSDAFPTASVAVTPRPDGAIEIVSDVVLVGGTAAYSPDGSRFAFSARPADASAGPDVYVWTVGDPRAVAVTTDHASLFAGWLGADLLVSRAAAGEGRTSLLAADGSWERAAHDGPMWRPVVGPGDLMGVWWDGTVVPTADGLGWLPGEGELVLETWTGARTAADDAGAAGAGTDSGAYLLGPGGIPVGVNRNGRGTPPGQDAGLGAGTGAHPAAAATQEPSAAPSPVRQVLATTGITDWRVAWTSDGRLLAVWVTSGAAGEPGTLALYSVDPVTGAADLEDPRLAPEPAYAGFALHDGQLTWVTPGDDGATQVEALAWQGDTFGRLEVQTEDGTTVIR